MKSFISLQKKKIQKQVISKEKQTKEQFLTYTQHTGGCQLPEGKWWGRRLGNS